MSAYEDRDLGLSVLIYVAALACGIAIFVVPVLLANGPTVIRNPGAQNAVAQMVAARRSGDRYPVARLKQDEVVDPSTVAALSAKVKRAERERRRAAAAHRSARRLQHARRRAAPLRARRAQIGRSLADARPVGPHTPGPFQRQYQAY
jgi:hypothetical protein